MALLSGDSKIALFLLLYCYYLGLASSLFVTLPASGYLGVNIGTYYSC